MPKTFQIHWTACQPKVVTLSEGPAGDLFDTLERRGLNPEMYEIEQPKILGRFPKGTEPPPRENPPFLVPEYTEGVFAVFGDKLVPAEELELDEWQDEPTLQDGWGARMSSPDGGATDWTGPFESIEEAKQHIEEAYEVDPLTGERFEEYY